MRQGVDKFSMMSRRPSLGVSIFMGNEAHPMLRQHLPHIYQNCVGGGLKITTSRQSVGGCQRHSHNLQRRLCPGMKTGMANLEAPLQVSIHSFNVRANPDTNGRPLRISRPEINHLRYQGQTAGTIQVI